MVAIIYFYAVFLIYQRFREMDNVISFKPKYTLEQRQIARIVEMLTDILNNHLALHGYIRRPILGSEYWTKRFDLVLIESTNYLIGLLIAELEDNELNKDVELCKVFIELIEWLEKEDKEVGEIFTVTVDTVDDVLQFVFGYANGEYALLNFYDSKGDISSGVIKALNSTGMQKLGYSSYSDL